MNLLKSIHFIEIYLFFIYFYMNSKVLLNTLPDIFHFLWFFGDKTDEYLKTFINKFNSFINIVDINRAIICSIYEVSKIIENTNDWINTDKGLIIINENKAKIESLYEININNNIYTWKENENEWFLNIDNMKSSKIIVKNNWKDESKEQYIFIKYGNFIYDSFMHNDRYILNISNEFIKDDNVFDLWDIDNNNYIINRRGKTEIYPVIF